MGAESILGRIFVGMSCLVVARGSAIAWANDAHHRPNIILVMADDHGYGDTGFTGHPFVRTPHLDAMAETGVVFSRFYASAPVCSPTRSALLTGRHCRKVGVHGMNGIAQVMLNLGYEVAGSDLRENPATRRLAEQGAVIHIGHAAEQVAGADAATATLPLLLAARRTMFPVSISDTCSRADSTDHVP